MSLVFPPQVSSDPLSYKHLFLSVQEISWHVPVAVGGINVRYQTGWCWVENQYRQCSRSVYIFPTDDFITGDTVPLGGKGRFLPLSFFNQQKLTVQ